MKTTKVLIKMGLHMLGEQIDIDSVIRQSNILFFSTGFPYVFSPLCVAEPLAKKSAST
jgi:hypothetical protein